jgi:phosphotransferase system enzyme I (PtsI)
VVLVARDLTPSLTVQLDRDAVLAIACQQGTRTSHAAILAHSIGIPAVVGLPDVLDRVATGQMVVLDGWAGTLQVAPQATDIEEARRRDQRRRAHQADLALVVDQPARTSDGKALTLRANLDLPEELDTAVRHRAEGVGLMRTEFLVVGRGTMPTEDEQAELYLRVGRAFQGRDVVIRTFDLGGDKFPAGFRTTAEGNPFLGWRAIRVCLDHPEVFRPQVRGILRAAAQTRLKLMIPLVTTVDEVLATRAIVAEESEALRRAGVPAAASVPVGAMVETPAAVLIADRLAEASDFLSVGTNDLVQYTLAVDRSNARLAERFAPHHPAILRALAEVRAAAEARGLEVSVCGGMASDPVSAYLLVGLGYRILSVAAPNLPLIRWLVRQVAATDAAACVEAARYERTATAVTALARQALGKVVDLSYVEPGA